MKIQIYFLVLCLLQFSFTDEVLSRLDTTSTSYYEIEFEEVSEVETKKDSTADFKPAIFKIGIGVVLFAIIIYLAIKAPRY